MRASSNVVDAATEAWGTKVMRIEIKDLAPPQDITQSMARQMKAERERRAQILEAEGDKAAAVLRAEGAKQAAILQAEGRREAAFRDAEAREREAEAEAKATEMVSEAISKGDVNAIRYFLGLKYVEAFGQLATSNQQRTVIIPSDLSGLAGLVEGLRALNAQGEGVALPRTAVPPTDTPVGRCSRTRRFKARYIRTHGQLMLTLLNAVGPAALGHPRP